MRTKHRLLIAFIVLTLLMVLPTAALANKKMYQVRLSYTNELHEVVGSQAFGAGNFGTRPDGSIYFLVQVWGLSGQPTGAHIHGPADSTQNAPVIASLCGNPSPAPVATCPFNAADGTMTLEGVLRGIHLRPGVTPADFFSYMDSGMAYMNVHTALNPAGETRGQITPR